MRSLANTTVSELNPDPWEEYAFENIKIDVQKDMVCSMPLSQVINELGIVIRTNNIEEHFWHPSRVLRAVIDSSIDGQERVDLVNQATEFAVNTYTGIFEPAKLDSLAAQICSKGLNDFIVKQDKDVATVEASDPRLSEASAEAVINKTKESLLVIPVCHGGFLSGVQMFLYLKRYRPSVVIYPVRNSMYKKNDNFPKVVDAEIKYLQYISQSKTIVVCDEDSHTGKSVSRTVSYLRDKLPHRKIIAIVNEDSRPSSIVERQGQWWENKITGYLAGEFVKDSQPIPFYK